MPENVAPAEPEDSPRRLPKTFDPAAFGSFQVAACTGTITLRFQGPWTALN